LALNHKFSQISVYEEKESNVLVMKKGDTLDHNTEDWNG